MAEINSGLEHQERIGRLRVDHSRESAKALKILRDAGFDVTTIPVSGTVGPQLTLGSKVYYGLGEIEGLVKTND